MEQKKQLLKSYCGIIIPPSKPDIDEEKFRYKYFKHDLILSKFLTDDIETDIYQQINYKKYEVV